MVGTKSRSMDSYISDICMNGYNKKPNGKTESSY